MKVTSEATTVFVTVCVVEVPLANCTENLTWHRPPFALTVRPDPETTVFPLLNVTLCAPAVPQLLNVGAMDGTPTSGTGDCGSRSTNVPLVMAVALPFVKLSVTVTGVKRGTLPVENAFESVRPELETGSVALASLLPGMPCALVKLAAGMLLVMDDGALGATSTVTVTVHELVPTEDPSVVDPGIVAPLMRNVEVPAPVTVGLPQFAL